jgi:hypothetical protein
MHDLDRCDGGCYDDDEEEEDNDTDAESDEDENAPTGPIDSDTRPLRIQSLQQQGRPYRYS